MYKKGTEYESRNALTILKNICAKHKLNLNDLLDVNEIKKFEFEYHGKLPELIACQIFFKIIGAKICTYNPYFIFLECTKEKYIEFVEAFTAYKNIYKKQAKEMNDRHKKEKKLFAQAFIIRHEIYGTQTDEDRKRKAKKITEKELEEMRFANKLANTIDEDVIIYKQLK